MKEYIFFYNLIALLKQLVKILDQLERFFNEVGVFFFDYENVQKRKSLSDTL